MSETPPPSGWVKGQHGNHDVVVVEVRIRRDASGHIYSEHHPQDEVDHRTLLQWPSGGLEQVASGLLVEAVRREALFDLVLQISEDAEFPRRWKEASSDAREETILRMTQALQAVMGRTISRVAEKAVREAIDRNLPHER